MKLIYIISIKLVKQSSDYKFIKENYNIEDEKNYAKVLLVH